MLRRETWSAEHIAVLAAHLRGAGNREVHLLVNNPDQALFEDTLSAGDITVLRTTFLKRNIAGNRTWSGLNVVVAKKLKPKKAKEILKGHFDSDCHPKTITMCVIPNHVAVTRDEVVTQCLPVERKFAGRADVTALASEGLWITFFAITPTAFLASGPTRSGKSTVAELLTSEGIARVSGDSVLEAISKGFITASPALCDTCARGFALDNWGHSLQLISQDTALREELASVLASMASSTFVLDLWMPKELKKTVVNILNSRGFKVFSLQDENDSAVTANFGRGPTTP